MVLDHAIKLPKNLFRFIWCFLSQYKMAVTCYIFLSLTAGLYGPFNSILMKKVINILPQIHSQNMTLLFILIGLIVLNFLLFDQIVWRILAYINAQYTPLIIQDITDASIDYVLGHSYQFFLDNLSGKIVNKIDNLADSVEKIITTIASNFFRGAALLIAAFATAYTINPIFCLIWFAWFVLFTATSIALSKKFVVLADRQADAESSVAGELIDVISNHSNINIFSTKSFEQARVRSYLSLQCQAYSNTCFYGLVLHAAQGGLITIMVAFSAYFLVELYAGDLVTIGDFPLILGLALELGYMVWFTMSEMDAFNKAVGRGKHSLLTLMQPRAITDKGDAKNLQCTQGAIQFSNVTFYYQATASLFEDQSITIFPGQKVGLVGYSGSGKSTFIHLIMRFYDVISGSITIDGHDIRDIAQDSLHDNIGMIPQEPLLFRRSLMDNIRYGCIDATDEAVIDAAKKAHAHEFITSLAEGYQTLVGERGMKLSGGQRQRIAIARVILKNAPILILDEATSHLDSVTEAFIQARLWNLMQNKTTIVVAHRLSTLLHMDRILVFEKGHIVADGAHNDLLLKSTLYKTLWDTQVEGFLGDDAERLK